MTEPRKGSVKGGLCNLTRCETGEPANWYNHGSLAYYCAECADWLNTDEFNKIDAQVRFGHTLCTDDTNSTEERVVF